MWLRTGAKLGGAAITPFKAAVPKAKMAVFHELPAGRLARDTLLRSVANTNMTSRHGCCNVLSMKITVDAREQVILVDELDIPTGVNGKLDAHDRGLLHRAFSIFLFSEDGRTLVQRRAKTKYHSGGEWANTCCGHPRPDEPVGRAANRRLSEELGMRADLTEAFHIRYKALLSNDMTENEYVHVFVGVCAETPVPNPTEVSDFAYHELGDLATGGTIPIHQQTAWLRHYLGTHLEQLFEARKLALNLDERSRLQSEV